MEAATSPVIREERRRIDILVTSPSFTIAIENKPYALWQDGQLVSYWDHIRHQNAILLAFLGYGIDAQSEVERHWREDCRGKLRCEYPGSEYVRGYDYAELGEWALACAKTSKAANVSLFLAQFADFCARKGTAGMDSEESNELVSQLISSPENIESALKIEALMDTVRQELARKTAKSLQKVLPDWSITADDVYSERRYGVRVSVPGIKGSIDFYLFGPSEYIPWVGIEKYSSQRLKGDHSGKSEGTWKWWRALGEEDLGHSPLQIWRLNSEDLASRLSMIAQACVASG